MVLVSNLTLSTCSFQFINHILTVLEFIYLLIFYVGLLYTEVLISYTRWSLHHLHLFFGAQTSNQPITWQQLDVLIHVDVVQTTC